MITFAQVSRLITRHAWPITILAALWIYHLAVNLQIYNAYRPTFDTQQGILLFAFLMAMNLITALAITVMVITFARSLPKNSPTKQISTKNHLVSEYPYPMLKVNKLRVTYSNPAAKDLLSFWSKTHKQTLPQDLQETITQSLKAKLFKTYQFQHDTKIMSLLVVPVNNSEANLYGRDVTEERLSDQMKSEFVSLASHQLRTPLTATKWIIERFRKPQTGPLNPKQQELITHLSQSTIRQIRLVNDLLNISRLESGRVAVTPRPTNLNELLSEIQEELTDTLKSKHQKLNIDITTKVPQTLNIDPMLIREVLLNLLSNASKYSPKKGHILVTITRKDKDIVFSIKDSGMGIPDSDQPSIFSRFYRASNVVAKDIEGTGLGLYLVKMIVNASGGEITFTSSDKGTTFTFTLPRHGSKAIKGDTTLTQAPKSL